MYAHVAGVATVASLTFAACTRPPEHSTPAEAAELPINRPTVIAYFMVPGGAVDTMPDLAVSTDDWNYAMATLGDSVEAAGFAFAMIIKPNVRLVSERSPTRLLTLGEPLTAGYAFVKPGEPPCVRRSPFNPDSVLVVARALFAGRAVPEEVCSKNSRVSIPGRRTSARTVVAKRPSQPESSQKASIASSRALGYGGMSRWPHSAQNGPTSGVPQLRHVERSVRDSVDG